MTRSIRNEFHSELANFISEDIQTQQNFYYYFLGKVDPWTGDGRAPETELGKDQQNDNLIRRNQIFFKKIAPNDVSLATARFDWMTGEVIPQWDDSVDMGEVGYYRLTDDYNVYACLDNAEDATSTVKPSGTSFYPFKTADGYTWKYLYTIPIYKRRAFLSTNYMPVQRALSDSFYNKGQIQTVQIIDAGSGYIDVQLTQIQITATTVGSGATAHVSSVDSLGRITGIQIDTAGSAYISAKIAITNSASGPTTGSGAELIPVFTTGALSSVTISAAGVGYTVGDLVKFNVGGAILIPQVSSTTGSISGVSIIEPGAGYATMTVSVTYTPGSAPVTPTGKYAGNATALVEAILDRGIVQQVLVRDPGVNYPVDTTTRITVQGDGENAEFTPVVSNGQIVDVIIDNPGVGYSNIVLTVIGSGDAAKVTANIGMNDLESEQALVEQLAVYGAIHSIKVTNPGQSYNSATTTVSIVGDGVGATAIPHFSPGGAIARIEVTNPGMNYTFASIVIDDPNRTDPTGVLIEATARAVFPPNGGHGKDAVKQLFADTLSIYSNLRFEQKLTAITQEYRQFGLLKNPRSILSGKTLRIDSDLAVYTVTMDSTVEMVEDEVWFNEKNEFTVIEVIDGTSVILQSQSPRNITPLGSLSKKSNPAIVANCQAIQSLPVLDKYSGSLLYVSNENPFSFTENQGISVRTYLKF